MSDDEHLTRDEIDLAIERAAAQSPRLARAREQIISLLGADTDEGMRALAEGIRRLMRQE